MLQLSICQYRDRMLPMAVRVLTLIFNLIVWFFVPLIALVMLYFARVLPARADDRQHESAMKAGFWAGVMLFVIILVYQISVFVREGFPSEAIYQGFNLWWAILSAVFGFFIFTNAKEAVSPKLAGLGILLLSFLGCYIFLHYLFIRTYNELLLSAVLGITFGVLTHFASTPGLIRRVLHSR